MMAARLISQSRSIKGDQEMNEAINVEAQESDDDALNDLIEGLEICLQSPECTDNAG